MASTIPPGFGRGGVPVRHRHTTTSTGGSKEKQTDASRAGHELPLFYGQPTRRRARVRRRRFPTAGGSRASPEARRRAFLRRVIIILICIVLLTSYFRSGNEGGEAELANSVEDFNDWKQLRADRKQRRIQERVKFAKQQQKHEKKQLEETESKFAEEKAFGTKGWDLPLIHIVNTRFMQSQGQLQTLAWARLHLFKAFCLSTMVQQTTQDFLWIIKTDPNLDVEVRAALVEMLRPYPNYYLVGSEHNYLIGHEVGAWRGGVEGADLLESPIYTGDVDLLKRAHAVQEERIVLETRLDADDGLTTGYLGYVQRTALEKFGGGSGTHNGDNAESEQEQERPKWMYWCSRQNAEWFADPTVDVGVTNAVQHTLLCVTPGITIGFPVGTPYEDVRQFEHTRIIKDINKEGGCSLANNTACVDLVTAFPMMAVRSRTPTSAGMMGIRMEEKDALDEDKRLLLWKLLQSNKYFGIDAEDVRTANRFIHQNIIEIARDNLKGQCTRGHSCKQSSKEQLQRLTELALMKDKGISIDEPKYIVLEDE